MNPKKRLKEAKSLLDLQLISQAEYDEIKTSCLQELGLIKSTPYKPSARDILDLSNRTGKGLKDCTYALIQSNGDTTAAFGILKTTSPKKSTQAKTRPKSKPSSPKKASQKRKPTPKPPSKRKATADNKESLRELKEEHLKLLAIVYKEIIKLKRKNLRSELVIEATLKLLKQVYKGDPEKVNVRSDWRSYWKQKLSEARAAKREDAYSETEDRMNQLRMADFEALTKRLKDIEVQPEDLKHVIRKSYLAFLVHQYAELHNHKKSAYFLKSNPPPIEPEEFDIWVKKEYCIIQQKILDNQIAKNKKNRLWYKSCGIPFKEQFPLPKPHVKFDPSDPSFKIIDSYNAYYSWRDKCSDLSSETFNLVWMRRSRDLNIVQERYTALGLELPTKPPSKFSEKFDTWVKKEFCIIQQKIIDNNYSVYRRSYSNVSKPNVNLDSLDPDFDLIEAGKVIDKWIGRYRILNKVCEECGETWNFRGQSTVFVSGNSVSSGVGKHYCSQRCADSVLRKDRKRSTEGIIQYIRNGQLYTL